MSDTPDLSTLPKRMRYAADVMDEAKRALDDEMYGEHPRGVRGEWHSDALRKRATLWDEREQEKAVLHARIDNLAQEIYGAHRAYLPHINDDWEGARESIRSHARALAAGLIGSGWRKGDSE